eukprot:546193-Rhodomonas_salina.2
MQCPGLSSFCALSGGSTRCLEHFFSQPTSSSTGTRLLSRSRSASANLLLAETSTPLHSCFPLTFLAIRNLLLTDVFAHSWMIMNKLGYDDWPIGALLPPGDGFKCRSLKFASEGSGVRPQCSFEQAFRVEGKLKFGLEKVKRLACISAVARVWVQDGSRVQGPGSRVQGPGSR